MRALKIAATGMTAHPISDDAEEATGVAGVVVLGADHPGVGPGGEVEDQCHSGSGPQFQDGLADADAVAGLHCGGPGELLLAQPGAVGGAQVF